MALASTVVYSKVQSRARLQQRKHRVRVPLLGENPKRSLIGVGITCVDLGLETQQQLHQVLAPLLGREESQRPLPACGACIGSLDLWRGYFAEPQSPTGPKKRIQGGDCCPRRMSLLRFPWLFPIRNSSELRGLHRRSYFGPRTCDGGITNVIEVCGAHNQGFPFSPLLRDSEGGVMRLSHFICQTLWTP